MHDPIDNEEGILLALLQGFENHRLPRTLHIKETVDSGSALSEDDLGFLEKLLGETEKVIPKIDRHPRYHDILTLIVQLYSDISKKALENEKTD